ncbi:MAG TPA: hypothetical protein VIR57_24245 [Chloroflexota bacterium]|jgi:hypothetical protein|nr:hypothetical protein [Candidatus Dormibacteraeota bacterium]
MVEDGPLPLPDSPKLRRAAELFEQAVHETLELMRAGGAVRETRPAPGAISYEFPPAPEHIRLVLGDCFQSLRSALDHEVYSLSAASHGSQWADRANTAFPLAPNEHVFRSQGRKQIRGLSSAAQTLVETLQPFQQPQHPIVPLLVFVHDVARVDRHRLLNLAALQPRSVQVQHATGRIGLSVELRFVMSEFSGRDALGAAKQAIGAIAWTIDGLRAADGSAP